MIKLSNKHRLEYVVASGALGFDGKGYLWEQLFRLLGLMDVSLFTVVSKTTTFKKEKGHLNIYDPLTWPCIRPMRGGSLNSIGLTNPGFEWFCENIASKADSSKIPLIPSIMSDDTNELIDMAQRLNCFDIVGIEKNPIAHEYGLLNLKLNKKTDNISLIQGDVTDILPQFTAEFDRIIMPLPKSAGDFVDLALPVLQPGGCLHFYDMQHPGSFEESVAKVRTAAESAERSLLGAEVTVCGHCAPRTYRICVDAFIS